jgi:hypothetical protein
VCDNDVSDKDQCTGRRDIKGTCRVIAWEKVNKAHPKCPQKVGEAFYCWPSRIPLQTMAVRQVLRVTHRYHGVVEEAEVPLPRNGELGALDEDHRPSQRDHERRAKFQD